MRLALGMALTFDASVAKGLKLKLRKFWWLIPTFVEVTGGKLVGRTFFFPLLILNRVNDLYYKGRFFVRLILLLNYVKLLRGTKNTENLRQYKSRFSLFVDQTGFCFKHLMSPNLKQIAWQCFELLHGLIGIDRSYGLDRRYG